MGLDIAGHTFERILIVDDDPRVRDAYSYVVEELELEPVPEQGPIDNFEKYLGESKKRSDAAICDHHLFTSTYADFNGARLVSGLNQRCQPAILCTRWEDASIDEIRPFRKYIPCLIQPEDLDPESIRRALMWCLDEFRGLFRPSREPSRTLVRVEDVDDNFAYVVLPGWNPYTVVRIPLTIVNQSVVSRIKPGARVHAHVNIGAETHEELYFERWEEK